MEVSVFAIEAVDGLGIRVSEEGAFLLPWAGVWRGGPERTALTTKNTKNTKKGKANESLGF